MIKLVVYARLLLSVVVLGLSVWSVVWVEDLLHNRGHSALISNAQVQGARLSELGTVTADVLRGELKQETQPEVHVLGPLTQNMELDSHDITNVNCLQATEVHGLLLEASQPEITSLGMLTSNLNVGGHDVTNANLVSTQFLDGVLLTASQPLVTSLGPMTYDLDMNGHAVLEIRDLQCDTFNGLLSDETMSRITHLDNLQVDVDVGQSAIHHVHELLTSPPVATYGTAYSGALSYGSAGVYSLKFSGLTKESDQSSFVTDALTGREFLRFDRSGFFCLSAYLYFSAPSAVEVGWLRQAGNVTVRPSQQVQHMLGFTILNGTASMYCLPPLIHYFSANETVTLMCVRGDGTTPTLLADVCRVRVSYIC